MMKSKSVKTIHYSVVFVTKTAGSSKANDTGFLNTDVLLPRIFLVNNLNKNAVWANSVYPSLLFFVMVGYCHANGLRQQILFRKKRIVTLSAFVSQEFHKFSVKILL